MPRKATYLRLENEPGAEFEFYLAQKLGMTLGRLRREMSNDEFVAWDIYFQREVQIMEQQAGKGGGGV